MVPKHFNSFEFLLITDAASRVQLIVGISYLLQKETLVTDGVHGNPVIVWYDFN